MKMIIGGNRLNLYPNWPADTPEELITGDDNKITIWNDGEIEIVISGQYAAGSAAAEAIAAIIDTLQRAEKIASALAA